MKLRTKYKRLKKELEALENITINNQPISDKNLILIEAATNMPINLAVNGLYKVLYKLKETYKDKKFIIVPKNLLEICNLTDEEYDFLNNIINRKNNESNL